MHPTIVSMTLKPPTPPPPNTKKILHTNCSFSHASDILDKFTNLPITLPTNLHPRLLPRRIPIPPQTSPPTLHLHFYTLPNLLSITPPIPPTLPIGLPLPPPKYPRKHELVSKILHPARPLPRLLPHHRRSRLRAPRDQILPSRAPEPVRAAHELRVEHE